MPVTQAVLDHLAVAAETWEQLWPRYRVELGGTWVSGDRSPGAGFGPAQLRFANGMKIELLQPVRPEDNDFLRRFLDGRGPGPHHITFKVPDIVAKLAEVEEAGYRPVGVDLRDPNWKEAFIHPKDGPGIVVQLAEAGEEWASPPPDGFPDTTAAPAAFEYLAIGAADFDRARSLFCDLLDAAVTGKAHDERYGFDYVELSWPSGGVIRLFEADSSGLHHACFRAAGASGEPVDVAAEVNLGVRLSLSV